jgi:hypothetical protein
LKDADWALLSLGKSLNSMAAVHGWKPILVEALRFMSLFIKSPAPDPS